ncbi:MAG: endolytic transglycosylase MltG [Bacillota bacterium]|jgi:UPF0755 protein
MGKLTALLDAPLKRKVLLAIFLAGMLAGAVLLALLSPVQWFGASEPQRVTIAAGSSARAIAQQLAEVGLIRSQTAFHLLSRLQQASGALQAGVYEMSPNESTLRLIQRLSRGDTLDLAVTVTIPEGYTVKQIARTLADKSIVEYDAFLEYLRQAPLPYDWLNTATAHLEPERRFEGYLFPDTYQFLPGSQPAEVVAAMTSRFRQVMESLLPAEVLAGEPAAALPQPLTLDQIVTLASIVEREAVVDQERPIIAGVFYNRLNIKQALQSCATVQYILEKVKPVLSTQDTQIESPYNTYKYPGLPPGPIAAPGLPSLQAVVEPAETDYYYFRAKEDGSGTHIFSRTLAEHNRAGR